MTLDRPELLALLLLLVPLALLARLSYLRGRQDLLRLTAGRQDLRLAAPARRPLPPGSLLDDFFLKSFFTFLFFALFVAGAVFALAGPRWGQTAVEEERSGREVVLVLDVSNSMLARDVVPSRLEAARAVGRYLLQNLPDSRFALVAFKGRAVRLLPLTEDTHAVESFLAQVSGRWIAAAGTDIEQGIAAGLESFLPGQGAARAIVLFTDGESLSGDPSRAARRAGRAQAPILVVSAGTVEGAGIRVEGTEVKDEGGRAVVSRLRPEPLARIAGLSGGKVIPLDARAGAELVARLAGGSRGEFAPGIVLVRRERYRLPLLLALIFLALSLGVRGVRLRSGL